MYLISWLTVTCKSTVGLESRRDPYVNSIGLVSLNIQECSLIKLDRRQSPSTCPRANTEIPVNRIHHILFIRAANKC